MTLGVVWVWKEKQCFWELVLFMHGMMHFLFSFFNLNMKLIILEIEKVYYQQWSPDILLRRLLWACAHHEMASVLNGALKAPVVAG